MVRLDSFVADKKMTRSKRINMTWLSVVVVDEVLSKGNHVND